MKHVNPRSTVVAVGIALFGFILPAFAQAPDPDLNNDGVVNILDVSLVGSCMGQDVAALPQCSTADTDGDGDVDMDDMIFVSASYGVDGFPICESNCFPNGVAAGDIDQSSVVLWTRAVFDHVKVRFEYGRDPDFVLPPDGVEDKYVEVVTDEDGHIIDYIPSKVPITGLLPGTQYYYRVCAGTCPSGFDPASEARGSFRTPFADGHHGLRFGVSSCARADLRPFVSIRNVPDRDLDFFVALGDTVYADSPLTTDGKRATTLDQFRKKNELGYSQKSSPDDNYFALARASTAFYVNIDDHEVINNFAGGAPPRSQKGTAECTEGKVCFCPDDDPNGNCDRPFINETDLFKYGLQAWYEYNPIIREEERYSETGDRRTAGKDKIYRYRTFGKDAALFMLDARSFRDKPITIGGQDLITLPSQAYDNRRTMLGSAQLRDLLDDLQDAQARGITWKFVLVPEPIQELGNVALADRFEGYAYERFVILDHIESFCIANVVFISGDIHGTIANNLAYKKHIADVRPRYSATWDISTGPIAYAPPYGPLLVEKLLKLEESEELPPEIAENLAAIGGLDGFEMLLSPDSQNELIKILTNALLVVNRSPRVGLDPEELYKGFLQTENADTPATLLQGRYDVTNTYGWTEFEIDAATRNLTVTTYGIEWCGGEEKPCPPSHQESVPSIVSQFEVTPVVQAGNDAVCTIDDDCISCRCSFLAGIGQEGLGQCIARLSNGEVCIGDEQCESGRCSVLGDGLLAQCQAKLPNGGVCLNDNDCANGDCSGGFCRPSPNGQPCLLDSSCQSDRCSVLGDGLSECRAKLPNGSICLNDNDCESDSCSGFQCVQKGQFCIIDKDCESGRCSDFECQPKLPNGGICLNNNDCINDDCRGGFCRPSPNGTPCLLDSSCESVRCTALSEGLPPTCEAKAPNGGHCLNDNDCASDRCSALVCKAREPAGSGCVSGGECISGICDSFRCKAVAPNCKASGAVCNNDWECCSRHIDACDDKIGDDICR